MYIFIFAYIGYTGSDIKEVCREAVVRVSHQRAHALESGGITVDTASENDGKFMIINGNMYLYLYVIAST
jgi:SpoVK/Ycf46/Vps4 family AAA+-type ATPase